MIQKQAGSGADTERTQAIDFAALALPAGDLSHGKQEQKQDGLHCLFPDSAPVW